MIDNEDGTFTTSYQPTARGLHQIHITMRNIHINGSPFSVNVTGRMDFGKVGKVMACFGCEGAGGGRIQHGKGEVRGGYAREREVGYK